MSKTIATWLAALGLECYAAAFAESDVNLRALPYLTEADLRELGVSLGHRRILLAAIAERIEAGKTQATSLERAPGSEADFRVLSILFCDLVGSTRLSQQLDPEAMRELFRRYQDAVAGAVTRYEGHVAKYLGDGVLAYFGWPVAYEDHAERAARAGLEALAAVGAIRLSDGDALAARVGIATGQVVVGDLIGASGREQAAVAGETPNLAARIQAVASAGELLVEVETARLTGRAFDLDDLGECRLKGFERSLRLFRVRREREVESRFEAARGASLFPFVGRAQELGMLGERWATCRQGQGQAVTIEGEAGIGKSRLVEVLLERAASEPHELIRLQCSPYHANSSLHPIIERLWRFAGFAPHDRPAERLAKLEQFLEGTHDDVRAVVPIFAELLSIDTLGQYPTVDLSPQELKERTLSTLVERLVLLARRAPVLLIVEDAHWIDPTTHEVLQRVVTQIAKLPVMIVVTHRPEWRVDWAVDAGHAASLALGRLDRVQVAEMIGNVLGRIPNENLVDDIAARTDGVPFFVEELTRAVVDDDAGGSSEARGIPVTVQASLMARLDRLAPTTRSVALVASVVGREFDRTLLQEVTNCSADGITDALERLSRAQLVIASGAPDGGYMFRHALIQDTAYGSLLARTRREHHERIAKVLIARRPDLVELQPEVVARHFTEAGRSDKALPYWHRAARRNVARAANHEAVSQSEQALAIAFDLADPEARERESLAAQLVLGIALANLGRLLDSLPPLQAALEAADRRGDAAAFVEAALELDTTYFLLGDGDRTAIGLLQKALAKIRNDDVRTRCQITGRLSRAMLLASDAERAADYNREAAHLARGIGDGSLLFDVMVNELLMPASTRPEAHRASWRERMDELCNLADSIGDDARGRAISLNVYVSAEVGDRARMDAALERLWMFSQDRQRLHVQWIATHGFAMRAIMMGEFAAAERYAELGWDLGHRTHGGQFEGVYGIQMFAIRREQGRLAEVAPVIRRLVDDNPDQRSWKPGFAVVACELGFKEPAQRILDELAATGFTFPLDAKHSTTLAYLAEVCVALGDAEHAGRLYELLLPYRHMTVTAGVTTVCYGAAGRFLGALAGEVGDWVAAEEHFEQALEMNATMGAPTWLAHTQCAYAETLRRRGRIGDSRLADSLVESALGTAAELQMVALKRKLQRFVQ